MKKVLVSKLKPNPNNPRSITKQNLNKLVKSIQEFPEMLNARPIIVNKDMVVLGGNMRLKALQQADIKEVHVQIVDWSKKKQNEFVIKDNASFGDWEYELLEDQWNEEDLKDWAIEVPTNDNQNTSQEQEIEFSEYLDESHNYVVLLFDSEVDWLSAQTHFDIKSVHSMRANGKPWSKGIGRVINGAKYLRSIKDE